MNQFKFSMFYNDIINKIHNNETNEWLFGFLIIKFLEKPIKIILISRIKISKKKHINKVEFQKTYNITQYKPSFENYWIKVKKLFKNIIFTIVNFNPNIFNLKKSLLFNIILLFMDIFKIKEYINIYGELRFNFYTKSISFSVKIIRFNFINLWCKKNIFIWKF
jgi:hypothetical protein